VEEHWAPKEGAGQGLAQRLHQEGLAGPLRWLENCLRRTARDREEDGVSHPVPLVPLSEENEDAMEDQCFQALLRQLGLRPPASEQESFWRIPAALTPQRLRHAAASISHLGLEPLGSPQVELPRCPQNSNPDLDPWVLPTWGQVVPTPVPHCCSEEPVPSPMHPGTKRRRELDSEDEGSSGGFSPSALSWGPVGALPLRCSP
ncbi:TIM protein, partial [Podargus strigoides]|nr:TIM protein [Podargus strigoides]